VPLGAIGKFDVIAISCQKEKESHMEIYEKIFTQKEKTFVPLV